MSAPTDSQALTSATFGETLFRRAKCEPERTAFAFLSDTSHHIETMTYRELHCRAQSIAAGLLEQARPGSRALLLFAPGLDYVSAVFGCFQAGIVGVAAPPPQPKRLHRTLPRLLAIAADAEIDAVLTLGAIRDGARSLFDQQDPIAQARWIATDECPDASDVGVAHHALGDAAFLQYTSGSTADPRGVVLTHENLLENSAFIQRAFGHSEHSQGFIWLPPYHDMGLIGGVLQPVHVGFPCALMSPLAVIKRPSRWLEGITQFRATTSGGPNFAYDLCVRRVDAETRERLDLSSWEVAFNGAEPIRADSLREFSRAFESCGFRSSAFFPCYGLAEATLMVTGVQKDANPPLLEVDANELERGVVCPASDDGAKATLVGCGRPYAGHQVAIVDTERLCRCAPGEIGEIWVSGPSVARGYWRRPEDTEAQFNATLPDCDATFLRTGDLGAYIGGELVVVGRLKEVMIFNGRNFHPYDIEFSAEAAHVLLRPHCSAAFDEGTDDLAKIGLLLEIDPPGDTPLAVILAAVRRGVADSLGLPLHWVGLCERGTVPKTTSGKVQRRLCRTMVEEGDVTLLAEWRADG